MPLETCGTYEKRVVPSAYQTIEFYWIKLLQRSTAFYKAGVSLFRKWEKWYWFTGTCLINPMTFTFHFIIKLIRHIWWISKFHSNSYFAKTYLLEVFSLLSIQNSFLTWSEHIHILIGLKYFYHRYITYRYCWYYRSYLKIWSIYFKFINSLETTEATTYSE